MEMDAKDTMLGQSRSSGSAALHVGGGGQMVHYQQQQQQQQPSSHYAADTFASKTPYITFPETPRSTNTGSAFHEENYAHAAFMQGDDSSHTIFTMEDLECVTPDELEYMEIVRPLLLSRPRNNTKELVESFHPTCYMLNLGWIKVSLNASTTTSWDTLLGNVKLQR
jgi:hypothetical protein